MEKFNHTQGDDSVRYQVGDLTMAHVFEPTNIQNLSDMQAVLDAVEVALVGKVELLEALREAVRVHGDQYSWGPAARAAIAMAMGDKS